MRHSFQRQQLPRGWSSSSFLLSFGQGCRGGVSAVGTFGSVPWAALLRTLYFFRWCASTAAALTNDESLKPLHYAFDLFQAVALQFQGVLIHTLTRTRHRLAHTFKSLG